MITIKQTRYFEKSYNKLKENQQSLVNKAIAAIAKNPTIGERKKGDLAEIYVYKISMVGQLTLFGYSYLEKDITILLLAVGSHENFYRDIKRK